jgi:pantoate--beta-alanine ligase
MRIIRDINEMLDYRKSIPESKKTGFVPTMGALHQGHLSLINNSVSDCDYTIASIFVNPRQFNDKTDFVNYPIRTEQDIKLLKLANCDAVFIPDATDIYNNYFGYKIDFEGLDEIMEGAYRPGHFQGVVDIVYRLFDIIKPDCAYFGQKDYQQLLVIKKIITQTKMNIQIIGCPIIRDKSGLAMSSRNMRLTKDEQKSASYIHKIMESVYNKKIINKDSRHIVKQLSEEINAINHLRTEYISFCEPNSLKPVNIFVKNSTVILCLAVYCGKIRLIDNKVLDF